MSLTPWQRPVEYWLRPPSTGARWRQYDIALTRPEPAASARALFARLLPLLDAAMAGAGLHGWFFMRKPPDVRLRLLADPQHSGVTAGVAVALDELARCGQVLHWRPGRYVPEQARFGGTTSMDAVHAWFTLDSRFWAGLDQAEVEAGDARDALLLAVFDDLFAGCGRVPAWRRLAGLIGAPAYPGERTAPIPPARAGSRADPGVLAAYRAGNRWLAAALELALGADPRAMPEVAANVALFSFNRHGYAGERSGPLVARVLAGLPGDPE